MIWWFLILAASTGALLWAGVSLYLRVRRHMTVETGTPSVPEAPTENDASSQ
jgi:hypothetical protein